MARTLAQSGRIGARFFRLPPFPLPQRHWSPFGDEADFDDGQSSGPGSWGGFLAPTSIIRRSGRTSGGFAPGPAHPRRRRLTGCFRTGRSALSRRSRQGRRGFSSVNSGRRRRHALPSACGGRKASRRLLAFRDGTTFGSRAPRPGSGSGGQGMCSERSWSFWTGMSARLSDPTPPGPYVTPARPARPWCTGDASSSGQQIRAAQPRTALPALRRSQVSARTGF
jgi:hypothetical protein